MNLDGSADVLMNDGEVLATSVPFAPLPGISSSTPAFNTFGEPLKPPTPPLNGYKTIGGVFDQHLTQLKDAPRPPKFSNLPYATAQTGLVYDVRMRFHVEPIPEVEDIHPEDPRRIYAIFEAFVKAGIAWREGCDGPADQYMGRIDVRKVTKEEACLVHTPQHWDWIQSLSTKTGEELVDELQHKDGRYTLMDSVYLSPSTPYCAALSAGGAIEACRAVMLGKVKNVFAVIRPPGHHAEREDVKGFCFYDNVSIATKVCQREFGESCRKVLILDWDVHHGNGIQQAHYEDPNVLYISLHVHNNGMFYPEKSYYDRRQTEGYGTHLHCGQGPGKGYNINVPWRKHGMGDGDYLYAFQQVIMPIATEFDPDLVIIAAGFDAAEGDMLGGCHVTPAGYAHMTHMLMSLANGKVAVCLEGGYNLESIARSATAVARTLMGEPPDRIVDTVPTKAGIDVVKTVALQQSKFWSCLYPKDMSARLSGPLQGERMHDVVRKYQAAKLWEDYEMSSLFILSKPQISKSFENQVLATSNYTSDCPLLIVLHDPPEVLGATDQRTGRLELHNTFLTDVVKSYVDWAVKHDFAVIDVNLPKYVTADGNDPSDHQENSSVEDRTKEATDLLKYLWENYVELNESSHVFLMGTNTGHGAIINFIKNHEETAQDRVTKAISFVEDVPLQSCRSPSGNDQLITWYKDNSLVFIAEEHNFWMSEYARKPKKRFGRIVKSQDANISDMLATHRDAVTEMLREETAAWREEKAVRDQKEKRSVPKSEPLNEDGFPSNKLPPISNFALSPARQGTRSPHLSSPTKFPTIGPRSPFR